MLGSLRSPESSELQSDEPVSFFRGLKLVMNHGAYIKLITGFLFTSLAFMVSAAGLRGQREPGGSPVGARWAGDLVGEQPLGSARGRGSPPDRSVPPLQLLEGNFALFCTYTLGFRNEFQNILLVIMVRTLPPEPPGWGCVRSGIQHLPRGWHGEGGRGLWGQRPKVPWEQGREKEPPSVLRRPCWLAGTAPPLFPHKGGQRWGEQEPWGPFVQIWPLISLPPRLRTGARCWCQDGAQQLPGALSTLPALWGGEVQGARALRDLAPGHAVCAAVARSGPFPRLGSAEPSPVPAGWCWPCAHANPRLS